MTLQLGVADKQPVTDGGRTIVMGLLFLTMLMQAVYTGSLNTILMTKPTVTAVTSKSDFIFKNSSNYQDSNVLCLPSTSASNYFDKYMFPLADEPIKVREMRMLCRHSSRCDSRTRFLCRSASSCNQKLMFALILPSLNPTTYTFIPPPPPPPLKIKGLLMVPSCVHV